MKLISTHPDDPNQKRLQAEKERVQERRRLELRNDLYQNYSSVPNSTTTGGQEDSKPYGCIVS